MARGRKMFQCFNVTAPLSTRPLRCCCGGISRVFAKQTEYDFSVLRVIVWLRSSWQYKSPYSCFYTEVKLILNNRLSYKY